MRQVKYISFIAFAVLLQVMAVAQSDSLRDKAQFKFGIYYNSNLHYYGRTDSLRSCGVFPLAEIWFDEHFYINAAPVFVNNKIDRMKYAGTIVTAGYMFNDHKRWAGNIYIVKPFYQNSSQLVQSALKAQVAATLTLQNKIINFTAGGDLKFSNSTDIGATAAIDHIFRLDLPGKSVLVIDPSATVNGGTQQFTNTYFEKTNFLLLPGPGREVSNNVQKFNILSYEFSAPVIFAKGKFQFLLIPSYVIPKNLISVPDRPDLSERGRPLFYATAGVKVTL